MSLGFHQRLSFAMAGTAAWAALVLGLILAAVLLVVDYRYESSELVGEIEDALSGAERAAAQAVQSGDESLAREVVERLLKTDAIVEATLADAEDNVLGTGTRQPRESALRWLTRAMGDGRGRHELMLRAADGATANGRLWVVVDRHQALARQVQRWPLFIVFGLVAVLVFGAFVFFAFDRSIGRPLAELGDSFERLDPTQPGKTRLPLVAGARENELTALARAANRFVQASEKRLAQRLETEEALKEREVRLQRVAENIPGIVFQQVRHPDGRFSYSYVSAGINRLHGLDPERVVAERSALMDIIHPEDREMHIAALNESAKSLAPINMRIRHLAPDGSTIWMHTMSRPYRLDSGAIVWDGVALDVTEQKEAEARIQYLAHHDVLTGLPNRESFLQNLRRTVAMAEREGRKEQVTGRSRRTFREPRRTSRTFPRSRRSGTMFAVLFLDLDDFKSVNDTLGHGIGDLLLKAVAERLQGHMRRSDALARYGEALVSRLGGDEFTVILNNLESVDGAATAAQRIIDALAQTFSIEGNTIHTGTSIGIAIFPDDGDTAEQLLRNADLAMYRSKADKVNKYHYYVPEMDADVLERKAFESDLRQALAREELWLCYQPQVEVRSGRIVGMEALLRWAHPERGEIPPAKVIPAAEATNLILPIGEWVLRTACAQNKAWQEEGLPRVAVTVNVSGAQIAYQDVLKVVGEVLADTGLAPEFLHIEVTESVVISNLETALATMHGLRKMGVKVYLDDFGTGFSSLSYLKRFPIDTLKIDRTFVRDITINADDAAIARAIINMAHSMNMLVTAEGVETEAQYKFLSAEGCDIIQGHYFSRAVPPEEFAKILREDATMTPQAADAD